MQIELQTSSAKETEAIAEKIGKQLKGGEVIELTSDLGGGKTTFIRGLARGFGSSDRVASPTFTISKVYKNGARQLHHFDFYRLPDSGLVGLELQDVIEDPTNVIAVEWSGVVSDVLPKDRLTVEIKAEGESSRQLHLNASEKLGYLVKGL